MKYVTAAWCAWMGLSLVGSVVGLIVLAVKESIFVLAIGGFGVLIGGVVAVLFLLVLCAVDMWEKF